MKPPKGITNKQGVGLVFLAVIGGAVFLSSEAETAPCDDARTAYIVSQSIVAEDLPEPRKADFLAPTDKRTVAIKDGDCSFYISSGFNYPAPSGEDVGFRYQMTLDLIDVDTGRYQERDVVTEPAAQPW